MGFLFLLMGFLFLMMGFLLLLMESPCPRVGRTTLDLAFEGFLRNGRFSAVFCFQLPEGASVLFSIARRCISHAAAKDPTHGSAVGEHRRDARKCPRMLARSSQRMHMGSN